MITLRKHNSSKSAVAMLGMIALLMVASPAFAQDGTIGDVATRITSYFGAFADLIMGAMFLVGIGIGAMSALKFKAHNEDPRSTKITTPIVFALVSAVLIGLPAYLTIMKQSVVEGDANSLDEGAYEGIGG